MTCKQTAVDLINRMPEELAREVQHYAEYLYDRSQREDWSGISLAHLAARYGENEVEYTLEDLRR